MTLIKYFLSTFLIFSICFVNGQSGSTTPASVKAALPAYRPSREEVLTRYRKAALLDSNARRKVFKLGLQPNWQKDGETFWYQNRLVDSTTEYILVNAAKNKKQKAFDHQKLAEAFSVMAGQKYDGSKLNISSMRFEDNGSRIRFLIDSKWWLANLQTYVISQSTPPADYRENIRFTETNPGPLIRRARAFRSESTSPDKAWNAVVRDGNVFVRPSGDGDSIQFTFDGNREQPYGSLSWSPDSKRLVGYKIDPVKAKTVSYILTSASGTRGEIKTRPYDQPGDENTSYDMFLFNLADKKASKVNTGKIDFLGPPIIN
ncbi:MAG: DPP IV N-terminal domain-containing protein, partial [Chitinophagaceae bacterium]